MNVKVSTSSETKYDQIIMDTARNIIWQGGQVVVCGRTASGRTTLARYLAATTGATVLDEMLRPTEVGAHPAASVVVMHSERISVTQKLALFGINPDMVIYVRRGTTWGGYSQEDPQLEVVTERTRTSLV